MARQIAEQPRPIPGSEVLKGLEDTFAPKIEEFKKTLESPDARGKAEKYFSSLSKAERKVFLIHEMGEAARVLANLSVDLESHLDFYNTAPDKNVKRRMLRFFFPDAPRTETTGEKLKRVVKELHTGKPATPNLASKSGATERWRRRVNHGIDVFLQERLIMKKIEAAWNDPSPIARAEFRAGTLFNIPFKEEPSVVFTPFAMIVGLNDEDYDNVVDNTIFDANDPEQTSSHGVAIPEHKIFPVLSGRVTFIRKDAGSHQYLDTVIRHELFHLYFGRFIRKENLSKVQEFIPHTEKIVTIPLARQLIRDTQTNLQSLLLEETSAYLFNTTSTIDTDRANGFSWEQVVTAIEEDLGPNVSPDVLKSIIAEARTAQAHYLKQARSLQSCVSLMLEFFDDDNQTRGTDQLSDEMLRRNFLFLMSQWGPQRMAQFSQRLGFDQAVVDKEEKQLRDGLQSDMISTFTELTSGKRDKKTAHHLRKVIYESAWLYSEESLENIWKLFSFLLMNKGEVSEISALLRSLENSIIVRGTPLSQREVGLLQDTITRLRSSGSEKLRRHAPIITRLRKEFSPPKTRS